MNELAWGVAAFAAVYVFTANRRWNCEKCYQNLLAVGIDHPSWSGHQECKGCMSYIQQRGSSEGLFDPFDEGPYTR